MRIQVFLDQSSLLTSLYSDFFSCHFSVKHSHNSLPNWQEELMALNAQVVLLWVKNKKPWWDAGLTNEEPQHGPILSPHRSQIRQKSEISSLQVEFAFFCPVITGVCHDTHLFRLRIKKTRWVMVLKTEFEKYLNEKWDYRKLVLSTSQATRMWNGLTSTCIKWD